MNTSIPRSFTSLCLLIGLAVPTTAADAPVPTTTREIHAIKDGEAMRLRFTPDGKTLVLGQGGLLKPGAIVLLDPATMKPLPLKFDWCVSVNDLDISPDAS